MIAKMRTLGWLRALLLVVTVGSLALSGCTVIRYVGGDGGGSGGGGAEPEIKKVDLLVQADLRKSASAFQQDYQRILDFLATGLTQEGVEIRRAALAPMYRQSGDTVPLVYGRDEENAEFSNLGEAYTFYTRDDGAEYLTDRSATDGENLAALGLQLDSRAVYHPRSADPDARAYFQPPADGFVVVSLTGSARRCSAESSKCQLDGAKPGVYFTRQDDGAAEWLNLPGDGGLPVSRIFHVAITTAEGVDHETFYDQCTSQPNFPTARIDFMEHSEKAYFGPLIGQIRDNGGNGRYVDLCRAMSQQGAAIMKSVASDIGRML